MKKMPDTYDTLIRKTAPQFLYGVDWRLIKAQLWQESRLDPNAVSPVGALGIAQFMPATWGDMKQQMTMPEDASAFDPEHAIPAMCFYMDYLHNKWYAWREPSDRYALTLASYNAGIGNIFNAQKLANGANDYATIIAQLHRVTGEKNATETRGYVSRIFGYFVHQITGEM